VLGTPSDWSARSAWSRSRLAEQAKTLATPLHRGEITCTIEHDGTQLDPEA
jgi:hypothetical protein